MASMMFQALGCCTLLYMFSKQLLIFQPPFLFFKRKRRIHAIVNPSSTLPPLRRRAGVTVTVNISTPTVTTTRRDLRV
ncbi:hypothetical protein Hanom_Chr12g01086571 [Helianthus anomalus]